LRQQQGHRTNLLWLLLYLKPIMAKEKDPVTPEPDTSLHSSTTLGRNHKADQFYAKGEGVYLSKHAIYDLERNVPKGNDHHRALVPEQTIIKWYHSIMAQRSLDEQAAARLDQRRIEHEAECYPGTDTADPTLGTVGFRDKRNQFDLDRSRSTIQLSMTTGHRWLNGSSVTHSNYITIRVGAPDGRELVEVALTFDQFASFLVSSMHTPCTVDTYWSHNEQCVRLAEVVKPPESIHDQMEQRLGDRMDEFDRRLDDIVADIQTQASSGKSMAKKAMEKILHDLSICKSYLRSNRDFMVKQARGEVSSIVEQAAASIAWSHKLSQEELVANPVVAALLQSWVKDRALRAHNPESDNDVSADDRLPE